MTLTHDTVASTAREVCRSALESWELPDRVDDVLLVVTELVHNVRRHTDDGGHLRLSAHADAILVEVIETDPRPPHLQPLDPDKPGGRGSLLVSTVARRWGSRPTICAGRPGKTVWVDLARDLSA